MNIVLGEENVRDLRDRYTVLELDQFRISGHDEPVSSYCLVESVPLGEMMTMEQFQELHANLIKNYRSRNWKFCEDALEHLIGRWNGDLDSFYVVMSKRIESYKDNDPGPDWNPVIDRASRSA